MNNEEKILEILAQMQTTMTDVKAGLTDVNVRLGLVEAQLDKVENRLDKVETQLDKVENRLDKVETTQAKMQDEVHLINARIDMDVGRRLDALAEGQDVMEERMARMEGTLGGVKKLAEETGDKVEVIYHVVARHGEAIAELKKAE